MTPAAGGRLFVVGAGRAGLGIATAVRAAGGLLAGVHGRVATTDPMPVTAGRIPITIGGATAVLLAVRDEQLDAAIAELAQAPLAAGTVVFQASGSADPDYAVLRDAGHPCGTFHPLVPLARPERAPGLLRGAWVGVAGDGPAVAAASALARLVGSHTLAIPTAERARYHAAAVFASNFPTVLVGIAERLLADAGVDALEGRAAVRELLRSAAENVAHDDAAAALTGPVARGDAATVARHLSALTAERDARVRDAYVALTLAATEMAGAAGTSPAALAAIRALLGVQEPVSAD